MVSIQWSSFPTVMKRNASRRSDIAYVAQWLRRLRFPGYGSTLQLQVIYGFHPVVFFSHGDETECESAERHRLRSLPGHQPFKKIAFIHGGAFGTPLEEPCELSVVESQKMQNRRMQVMHMQAIFDSAQAKFVRGADRLAAAYSAASHPHRKAGGVVIATIAFF